LSKAITIIALTCFLVAGAAITSILSRESMGTPAAEPAPVVKSPVANRENKQDRLSVMSLASAALPAASDPGSSEVLRQAYASSSAADIEAAKAVRALPRVASLAPQRELAPQGEPPQTGALPEAAADTGALPAVNVQPAKPKVVAKPAPQKNYSLLSDAQIAGVKERLHLSSSQEYYWPGVETALKAVARKLNAAKLSNPHASAAQLDPDCEEVQQLKSAAMPLLFQLREDQKEEVRKLARIIGLEKVAAAI
jgi:ABC-type transporter Mla MlaB component